MHARLGGHPRHTSALEYLPSGVGAALYVKRTETLDAGNSPTGCARAQAECSSTVRYHRNMTTDLEETCQPDDIWGKHAASEREEEEQEVTAPVMRDAPRANGITWLVILSDLQARQSIRQSSQVKHRVAQAGCA